MTALFLMSSRVHAGLVWSTRQPICLHCAAHSTCHSLPELGFSTLRRLKTKQRLLDVALNAMINVSMNGPDRTAAKKSSLEGLYVCAWGLAF